MSLSSKAVLSTLVSTQWTARKLDRKVSKEVSNTHAAAPDAGRYNKLLINKAALDTIQQTVSASRQYHYRVTLPWNIKGTQILPAALFTEYNEKMNEYKRTFEQEVAQFIRVYPEYVSNAKTRLGDMFNPLEYPDVSDLAHRFTFDVNYAVIPNTGDIRVEMSNKEKAELTKQVEANMKTQEEAAVKATMERMKEVVERMYTSLSNEKRFSHTMVDGLRDLVSLIPSFNFTNNQEIKDISESMKKLCTHDAEDLRKDKALRLSTAKEADEILRKMSGVFQ